VCSSDLCPRAVAPQDSEHTSTITSPTNSFMLISVFSLGLMKSPLRMQNVPCGISPSHAENTPIPVFRKEMDYAFGRARRYSQRRNQFAASEHPAAWTPLPHQGKASNNN
jgi:hypothetical protein